tara:strand:+ start:209 stop:1462 length:1254 start_codon:yes stop_codon:yes gene_type:complete
MNNILPKNDLCTRLLTENKSSDRFSQSNETKQEVTYEIIDPVANKVWGYVCIDNTERGSGLGGIRIAPNVTLQEVKRLARVMVLKNSVACLPHGGAKSGILINDPILYIDRKIKSAFMKKVSVALFELDQYVPAPDMGTDEYDIQIIYEQYLKMLKTKIHYRGGAGRPFECGGVPIDEWGLTAHGLFAAAKTLENLIDNFKLNKSKIIIQGFGNVGCRTAIKLQKEGAVIVGVSDINCALWNPMGLDLNELCNIRKLEGGLSQYTKQVEKRFGPDRLNWLLEAPCDILIPAARPDAITSKNIDRIDCRVILQGANNPSSKPVEYYLKHRRNILSLTDFIVNSGGVIGCAVELNLMKDVSYANKVEAKGLRGYIEKLIFNTISKNVQEIYQRISGDTIFRDAATDLAYERLKNQEVWL